MYSYWIINKKDPEQKTVIFGHSRTHAFQKFGLNPEEWEVDFVDYED